MSVYAKLAAFQGEFDGVELNATNPHFKNKYATLSEVINKAKPVLKNVGLGFTQVPKIDGDKLLLHTFLFDADKPEDKIESIVDLPKESNPQKLGSTLTYYKRYCLSALLGISEMEDDDGNAGAQQNSKPSSKKEPAKKAEDLPHIRFQSKVDENSASMATLNKYLETAMPYVNEMPEEEKRKSLAYVEQIKAMLITDAKQTAKKEDIEL